MSDNLKCKNKETSPGEEKQQEPSNARRTAKSNPESPQHEYSSKDYLRVSWGLTWFKAWRGIKPVVGSSNVWIAVATIVIAISTIAYTRYARKQWDVMRRQLDFTERPWILLDKFAVEGPLVFDSGGGAAITFGFEIKNTGQSPAIRGFWQPDFFLQFGEMPSPVKKRNDACKVAESRSTKVADQRLTEAWFPGQGLPKNIKINFTPDDVADALKIPGRYFPNGPRVKDFDYIYPDFVVCVAYRSSFTDMQYHTGYILRLIRTNPKLPYIPPMKSGEIPAEELRLDIHPFYGIDAE